MGNIHRDMSLMWVQIKHPNIGDITINEHLKNITPEPISDTETISDPGVGGGRRIDDIKDTSMKISIEVNTGSAADLYLTRIRKYTGISFDLQWEDGRNQAIDPFGGTGGECYIKKGRTRDSSADTQTYEIYSLQYSGD